MTWKLCEFNKNGRKKMPKIPISSIRNELLNEGLSFILLDSQNACSRCGFNRIGDRFVGIYFFPEWQGQGERYKS